MDYESQIAHIVTFCKDHGITQIQISRAIDYTPTYISSIFHGRIKSTKDFLRAIKEWLARYAQEISTNHARLAELIGGE